MTNNLEAGNEMFIVEIDGEEEIINDASGCIDNDSFINNLEGILSSRLNGKITYIYNKSASSRDISSYNQLLDFLSFRGTSSAGSLSKFLYDNIFLQTSSIVFKMRKQIFECALSSKTQIKENILRTELQFLNKLFNKFLDVEACIIGMSCSSVFFRKHIEFYKNNGQILIDCMNSSPFVKEIALLNPLNEIINLKFAERPIIKSTTIICDNLLFLNQDVDEDSFISRISMAENKESAGYLYKPFMYLISRSQNRENFIDRISTASLIKLLEQIPKYSTSTLWTKDNIMYICILDIGKNLLAREINKEEFKLILLVLEKFETLDKFDIFSVKNRIFFSPFITDKIIDYAKSQIGIDGLIYSIKAGSRFLVHILKEETGNDLDYLENVLEFSLKTLLYEKNCHLRKEIISDIQKLISRTGTKSPGKIIDMMIQSGLREKTVLTILNYNDAYFCNRKKGTITFDTSKYSDGIKSAILLWELS